jgi:CMP-N,N'-diacetyllegionaminic acid synthase
LNSVSSPTHDSKLRVLAVIPARAGSRGVRNKNIRELCGKPLLQYTADAALAAKGLTRTILTTESEEIAAVGRQCNLEVIYRPAELTRDETPMLPVVRHAMAVIESSGDVYDAVCLLQPTNPMRRAEDIDACIGLFERSEVDSVVTVLPVPSEHNPHWVYFADQNGVLKLSTGENEPISRRQDLPAAWHREGSVYVTRRSVLMEENSLYGKRLIGYPLDPDNSVNVDTQADWERAEQLVAKQCVG